MDWQSGTWKRRQLAWLDMLRTTQHREMWTSMLLATLSNKSLMLKLNIIIIMYLGWLCLTTDTLLLALLVTFYCAQFSYLPLPLLLLPFIFPTVIIFKSSTSHYMFSECWWSYFISKFLKGWNACLREGTSLTIWRVIFSFSLSATEFPALCNCSPLTIHLIVWCLKTVMLQTTLFVVIGVSVNTFQALLTYFSEMLKKKNKIKKKHEFQNI